MTCTCENCGNEANMIIKCEEIIVEPAKGSEPAKEKVKREITCTQCGNEANMILDL